MARLFSRLGMGSIITLSLAFGLFVSSEVVLGAPIACTGSSSGSTGTCSTIANCNGTAENPVSPNSNGGPVAEVCPQDWICCIDASSGGTNPPKDATDPPTTPGPGQNTGSANQGTSCTVPTGGTGQCEFTDQCSVANQVPTSGCLGGTVCCVLPVTGGGPGINCGGTCRTVTNGCQAPETSISGNCGAGQVCCGVTGTQQSECALAGGSCRTVGFGCMPTETSSPLSCLSAGQVCCRLPGVTGPGGTNTTSTGSLECSDPTKYQKVAGVCFPKGTGLSEKSVIEIIAALVSWLLAIFGFIALLGFIISGIQYLLSTGDEGMAETAKRNMKYSIIGIIVALSGWIIIKAVDALLNANTLI